MYSRNSDRRNREEVQSKALQWVLLFHMRYHFDETYRGLPFGVTYICDHPVYRRATLFKIKDKGLCVIQQRFNKKQKSTTWSEIDASLTGPIYLHPKFKEYFDNRASIETDGLYPTVTVRQLMWALHMKPLKRQRWETVFDRRYI